MERGMPANESSVDRPNLRSADGPLYKGQIAAQEVVPLTGSSENEIEWLVAPPLQPTPRLVTPVVTPIRNLLPQLLQH